MAPTLDQLAMQLLLASGEAKQQLFETIRQIKQGRAPHDWTACQQKLVHAHQVQNQLTARLADAQTPLSVLCGHALDTMMAVESNYELAQALLTVPQNTSE